MRFFETTKPAGASGGRIVAPFESAVHAVAFAVMTLLVVAMPLLLGLLPQENLSRILRSMPLEYNNYGVAAHYLDAPENIDILILGSSETMVVLDPLMIEQYFAENGGGTIHAASFTTGWAGFDRSLAFLQATLEAGKRPRLVILGETRTSAGNFPHYLSKYFWRSDNNELLNGLLLRLKYHGIQILGSPLSIWRRIFFFPDLGFRPEDSEEFHRRVSTKGFRGQAVNWNPKRLAPGDTVGRVRAASQMHIGSTPPPEKAFFFENNLPSNVNYLAEAHSRHQTKLMNEIRELCRRNDITFSTVIVPINFELEVMPNMVLKPLHGKQIRDWPILGLTMAQIFEGLSLTEAKAHYQNYEHMNKSGGQTYTRLLNPSIKRLYDKNLTP